MQKIALEGVAEQAMPTDLAQRHEVVTRTRSMHGRTQLQDQAARPLTAPECSAVAALIEAAAVLVCLSRSARTGLIAADRSSRMR